MKKKSGIIFCSIAIVFVMLALVGCKATPYKVDWHLRYYEIDGEKYWVGTDYFDHFSAVSYNDVMLSFDEDGGFYFKNYDEEYNGTYSYKERLSSTKVTLKFPDGSKMKGECGGSAIGISYSAEFKIFGATYYFDNDERTFDAYKFRTDIAKAVYAFASTGEKENTNYYSGLTLTTIENDGKYYTFKIDGREYWLDDMRCFCYAVNSEYELKQSELKEGDCIVRVGSDRVAIYYTEDN